MAGVLEHPLGVADVDRLVGLAATLRPDLGEVDDRAAAVERADQGLGVAPHELHGVASRVAHDPGRRLERTMPTTSCPAAAARATT